MFFILPTISFITFWFFSFQTFCATMYFLVLFVRKMIRDLQFFPAKCSPPFETSVPLKRNTRDELPRRVPSHSKLTECAPSFKPSSLLKRFTRSNELTRVLSHS